MPTRPPLPAATLDLAGLNRQHVFDLAALPPELRTALAPRPEERQLILLGHGGRRLWDCVTAAGLNGEHPIDDYCRQTINRWFAENLPDRHFRLLYPGEQPVGLQQLGTLAGWHQPSPFMVGIDSEWGSWFAYRAVILADSDFCPSPRIERRSPCLDCREPPCIAACPGEALTHGSLDLSRCLAHRLGKDSPCRATCLARLACPVAVEHRYSEAQMRHSYGRSLDMLARYQTEAKRLPTAKS